MTELCTCGHAAEDHERCDFPSLDDCTVCTCPASRRGAGMTSRRQLLFGTIAWFGLIVAVAFINGPVRP